MSLFVLFASGSADKLIFLGYSLWVRLLWIDGPEPVSIDDPASQRREARSSDLESID